MTLSIETRDLTRRFGRTYALRGVDLAVPEGSVYALMGPNGAGKTTTLRLLLNLIAPDAGWAKVLGIDSARLRAPDFTRIGYVSEDRKLPEWMTVPRLAAYCRPFYPGWDDAFCEELIARFRLPVDRPIKALSRGMRIKVALLAALSFRPRLLVLDEPFGGLDPLVRDEMIEGVLDIAGEGPWTILISSHDMNELERLADHAGFLDEGRLLFSEDTATLMGRHRDVVVTLGADTPKGVRTPAEWLGVSRGDHAVRFVDTAFDEGGTPARIRSLFPGATDITATPMSLRSIFVAHAKSSQTEVTS